MDFYPHTSDLTGFPAWDYGKQYTRPDDLQVQRLKDRGPGYVCNFNNIEVYVGPLMSGQSICFLKMHLIKLSSKNLEAENL